MMQAKIRNMSLLEVLLPGLLALMALMASSMGYVLDWTEVLRLSVILAGMIFLYWRYIAPMRMQDDGVFFPAGLVPSPKFLVLFYFLTFAFLITQFDPWRFDNSVWGDGLPRLYIYASAGLVVLVCLFAFLSRSVRLAFWVLFAVALVLTVWLLFTFFERAEYWVRLLQCSVLFLTFFSLFGNAQSRLPALLNYRLLKWVSFSVILSFAIVVFFSVVRMITLTQLYSDAEDFQTKGQVEEAVAAYDALHIRNRFLDWPKFRPENTVQKLSDIAQGSQKVQDGYVLARVLADVGQNEEANKRYQAIEALLLKDENTDQAFLRNVFRSHAIALSAVQNWFGLVSHGLIAKKYFPNDPAFWSYICVGAAKSVNFYLAYEAFDKAFRLRTKGQNLKTWVLERSEPLKFSDLISAPGLSQLTLLEIVELLKHGNLGLHIAYEAEEIGQTGVVANFDIDLFSTPFNGGQPWLRINSGRPWVKIGGKDAFGGNYASAYHLAVLDSQTGVVDTLQNFNTWLTLSENQKMAQFIDLAPQGRIVVAVVNDEASANLTEDGVQALRSIGATGDLRGRHRWAHVIIGIKGAAPGTALESMSPYAIRNSVLGGSLDRISKLDSSDPILVCYGKYPEYKIRVYDRSRP